MRVVPFSFLIPISIFGLTFKLLKVRKSILCMNGTCSTHDLSTQHSVACFIISLLLLLQTIYRVSLCFMGRGRTQLTGRSNKQGMNRQKKTTQNRLSKTIPDGTISFRRRFNRADKIWWKRNWEPEVCIVIRCCTLFKGLPHSLHRAFATLCFLYHQTCTSMGHHGLPFLHSSLCTSSCCWEWISYLCPVVLWSCLLMLLAGRFSDA